MGQYSWNLSFMSSKYGLHRLQSFFFFSFFLDRLSNGYLGQTQMYLHALPNHDPVKKNIQVIIKRCSSFLQTKMRKMWFTIEYCRLLKNITGTPLPEKRAKFFVFLRFVVCVDFWDPSVVHYDDPITEEVFDRNRGFFPWISLYWISQNVGMLPCVQMISWVSRLIPFTFLY